MLAYIAHSINKELSEKLVKGPGEGVDYHWDKINIKHEIEWGNGKLNDESPGKIVYIPQNYLFNESKNPDGIKEKIKPVLFKILPDFEIKYKKAEDDINLNNHQISDQIENWFDLSDSILSLNEQIKDLGDKGAIEDEKEETTLKIKELKKNIN